MRRFDSSLSTSFEVEAVFRQGQWHIQRKDHVNWGLTGIEIGNKVNGSGDAHGPRDLVTLEQAEHYARHLAALWNSQLWIPTSERVPDAKDDSYGFCLESPTVLIKTTQGNCYTARYRVMLDDTYTVPDPDQLPHWVLDGQDGYSLTLEEVAAWLPIPA